jgi:hypothetical protein
MVTMMLLIIPYDLDSYGISKYSQSGWLNIPYKSVLGAKSICE